MIIGEFLFGSTVTFMPLAIRCNNAQSQMVFYFVFALAVIFYKFSAFQKVLFHRFNLNNIIMMESMNKSKLKIQESKRRMVMIRKNVGFSLVFFWVFCLSAATSFAAATLVWDPPATGDVEGYRIYFGTSESELYQSFDANLETSCPIVDLPLQDDTKYYFVVRAYNDSGESRNSNTVSWQSPDNTPPAPPNIESVEVVPSEADVTTQ